VADQSELRAAADAAETFADEVLRARPHAIVPRGIREIVRQWKAEHPADDGEPVTEDWLRASGFAPAWGHPFQLGGYDAESDIDVRCTPAELVVAHRTDEFLVAEQPTRGHVRRLCAALGIELTPPPAARRD
jgi:hypothetical protein